MKLIYIFSVIIILISESLTEQALSQSIYNVAGDVGNGLKIKNTVLLGNTALITVDKDNNIIATAVDDNLASIRKYDLKNDIVQTIAGNDLYGVFNEGGIATETCLLDGHYLYQQPTSITIDDHNNVYIACEGDLLQGSIIRKLSPAGYLTTYAGIGTPGFSGDGRLAIHAKLNQPKGIVFDKRGNMFIADDFNNRLRKVDKNGIITTYAGTGVAGSE